MNKSKTSKKVIAIMLLSIFVYVGVAVYTQIKVGVELSPTLTVCFFTVMAVEFVQLAGIKKAKEKTLKNFPTDATDFARIVLEELLNKTSEEEDEEEVCEDRDI